MNNPHESVNHIPFLSEEMERTLRRLAWRDEIFREALIADPKGIIQYLFHHHLPNGKLPNDLTINVIEQDASTHHIVLPAFADEEPILEIAEEEQLDLIVYLGALDGKRPRDSDESKQSHNSADKRKPGWNEAQFRRDQAKEISNEQDAKVPARKELDKVLLDVLQQDKDIRQAVNKALESDGNINSTVQMMQEKGYLSGLKLPKDINYLAHQDTHGIYHLVLQSSRDNSQVPELDHKEKGALDSENGCVATHDDCPSHAGGCGRTRPICTGQDCN